MRCLIPIIMIALIATSALSGYNYMRLNAVKSDMAEIQSKMQKSVASNPGEQDANVVLKKAKNHIRTARKLLEQGKVTRAKRELDSGMAMLEKASKTSEGSSSIDYSGIEKTWGTMRVELGKLLSEASKQMQEGRSGSKAKTGTE